MKSTGSKYERANCAISLSLEGGIAAMHSAQADRSASTSIHRTFLKYSSGNILPASKKRSSLWCRFKNLSIVIYVVVMCYIIHE